MIRTCANCSFFQAKENTCKRYPRTPVAHQNAGKKWIVSFLNPQTSPDDCCGEHLMPVQVEQSAGG